VIDAQATIRWANTAAERLMGSSLESWIGTSGLGLVHPDDVGLAALSLGSVQDKHVGTPIELRITAASGWTLVELVGAPDGDRDRARRWRTRNIRSPPPLCPRRARAVRVEHRLVAR